MFSRQVWLFFKVNDMMRVSFAVFIITCASFRTANSEFVAVLRSDFVHCRKKRCSSACLAACLKAHLRSFRCLDQWDEVHFNSSEHLQSGPLEQSAGARPSDMIRPPRPRCDRTSAAKARTCLVQTDRSRSWSWKSETQLLLPFAVRLI